MKLHQWQEAGELVIDSAEMVLMDRAYLGEVPDYIDSPGEEQLDYAPIVNDLGIELGAILRTGIGDGTYPIEVRFEDTPFGRRIAEVRIRFWPHPVLGYDVPG
jgi:hypothetical protein